MLGPDCRQEQEMRSAREGAPDHGISRGSAGVRREAGTESDQIITTTTEREPPPSKYSRVYTQTAVKSETDSEL